MLINDIKGLKYPDEYVVKFFFKNGLDKRKGKVLELGSGNGSNLNLFYQYGWDVTGVDTDETEINNGTSNFSKTQESFHLKNKFSFHCTDMLDFLAGDNAERYDVILFANSLYYLESSQIDEILSLMNTKKIYFQGSHIFFRMRKNDDFRQGMGEPFKNKSIRITTQVTGEEGCIMTFFSEKKFVTLLESNFKLENICTMNLKNENIQNGEVILNSDLIVWAKFN